MFPLRPAPPGPSGLCMSSWRRSTGPNRVECLRRWSASSATSTSPRRRCTTPFAPRWSNGRMRVYQPTRVPGSYPPAVSRRSTPCGGAHVQPGGRLRRSPRSGERGRAGPGQRRGRPPAADLHLLPSRLAPEAQVALTLREVCGLTTEEIARAFSLRRRRSRSASYVPRPKSATHASPMKCPGMRSCRPGSTAYCA